MFWQERYDLLPEIEDDLRSQHKVQRVQVAEGRYQGMIGKVLCYGMPGTCFHGAVRIRFECKHPEWESDIQWFLKDWLIFE